MRPFVRRRPVDERQVAERLDPREHERGPRQRRSAAVARPRRTGPSDRRTTGVAALGSAPRGRPRSSSSSTRSPGARCDTKTSVAAKNGSSTNSEARIPRERFVTASSTADGVALVQRAPVRARATSTPRSIRPGRARRRSRRPAASPRSRSSQPGLHVRADEEQDERAEHEAGRARADAGGTALAPPDDAERDRHLLQDPPHDLAAHARLPRGPAAGSSGARARPARAPSRRRAARSRGPRRSRAPARTA